MDDRRLFEFFRSAEVGSQFEFHGSLQHCLVKLFANLKGPVRFVPTVDPRITSLIYEHYCPGRTVSEIITRVENEFPITFIAIPTEDGGYDISLEYYERKFPYV